jgi:dihydrofolate reductase
MRSRLANGHWLWQSSVQKEGERDVTLHGERHRAHRPSLRCDEREAMLIYSMNVSVDGFITDREGGFGWGAPSEELFRFHTAQVRELGGYLCGRRLYETMLPWETDPSMRDDELRMFRHPVVVGGGSPFLPPVTEDLRLDLVEARTFGSRVIYERYRRAREESD